MRSTARLSVLLLAAALSACAGAPSRQTAAPPAATVPAHDNLNAVLWMQSAVEYEAVVRQSFQTATRQLDVALATPGWNALPLDEQTRREGFEALPPAVIVDADETMIDNSPLQARNIRDGGGFKLENWQAWVNERRARALPGALEFARHAAAKGVTIFFVTNRDAPQELQATRDNLAALGFDIGPDGAYVMLRGDARGPGREKSQRRAWVAERYRVLLLLGDNLGDFMDGVNTTLAGRAALVARYQDWWGTRWIMLPNPSYGSWEGALEGDCGRGAPDVTRPCKMRALRFD